MDVDSNSRQQRSRGLPSTVLGIGIATLIAGYAHGVKEQTDITKYIILAAPVVAVSLEWILGFLFAQLYAEYVHWQTSRDSNRIGRMLSNEHTSNEHKKGLVKNLEALQNIDIELATRNAANAVSTFRAHAAINDVQNQPPPQNHQ
jgi:hypothetical protein